MDIYNYDSFTGEFITVSQANQSPLEPGVFLVPANATTLPPLKPGPNQTPAFKDGTWTLVADYRSRCWDKHGSIAKIALGATPDGVETCSIAPPDASGTWLFSAGAWIVDPVKAAAAVVAAKLGADVAAAAATPAVMTLIAMSPAQVDAWCLANVVDLASARNAIAILAKIVAVVARNIVK